ncbi:MAG: hypothetical protein HYX68_12765, partial [Planctomycetes bacterium]|nr:hypothetical protein [Planctomycetota bacterium]
MMSSSFSKLIRQWFGAASKKNRTIRKKPSSARLLVESLETRVAPATLLEAPASGVDSYVVASAGSWSATANASWLHTSSTGSGNGLATFTFDANTGATRTGTLTIAGQTLTVTQAGSTYVTANPVSTLIPSGLGSEGVGMDGAGNIYYANGSANSIMKWNATTQTSSTLVSGLSAPALALDSSGNVYFTNFGVGIQKWTAASQTVSTLVSGYSPQGLAVDGSGNVYFGAWNGSTNSLYKWSVSTNTVSTLVSAIVPPSESLIGVAVDVAGNVYITNASTNQILEWNVTTRVVSAVVSAGLAYPTGVAVDASGNLYIANYGSGAISKWTAQSQQVSSLASISYAWAVAVDGVGNLVYTVNNNNFGALTERTRAFVAAGVINEGAGAGSDQLLPVLPTAQSLSGIFAPTSDQSWLTVGAPSNGVIPFSFTANTGAARSARITVLGQQITVNQAGSSLSATLSSGNLTIADTDATGKNNSVTVSRSGSNLVITDANEMFQSAPSGGALSNGNKTLTIPMTSVTGSLTFNTAGGNDTLTLDLSGGDPIPAGNLTFNGGNPTGAPGDALVITGGSQGTVTYNYTNANDGNIVMSNFGTVTYTGLDPITNSGTATDVIFNLPAGPNTATLGDDGTSGNGLSRLSGATFELTDFANPSNSLTINRGNSADTLTVIALPDFTAGLTVGSSATPFATINLSGSVTLASGKSMAFAGSNVNATAAAALTASGSGNITLTTDNIDIAGTASLTSAATATVAQITVNRAFNLGTNASGVVALTDAELDRVTAGTVQIGNASSGAITFSANLSRSATTNVNLTTGSGNTIALGTFSLNAAGGNIGLTTSGTGAITSTATSGDQLLGGTVNLSAGSGGIGSSANPIRLAASAVTAATSGNGNIFLSENGTASLNSVNALNAGAGAVTLTGGTFQALSAAQSFGGALNIAGATFNGFSTTTVTGLTTVSSGTYSANGTHNLNGGLTVSGGSFNAGTANVTVTNVTLSSGTLTPAVSPGSFNVSGNWQVTSAYPTANIVSVGTVTFTAASGVQTVDNGPSVQQRFNNLSHTGAGTLRLVGNGVTLNGNFSNTNGTFDAATNSLGLFVSGFTGVSTISGGTYLAGSASSSFTGLTINGGTYSGGSGALQVSSDFTLSSGSLIAPSSTFYVYGNWSVTGGTFIPGSGTVSFPATSSSNTRTLNSGGQAFNNISHQTDTLRLITNPLVVNGTLLNFSGTYDASTNNLSTTVAGLTTITGGNYLAGSATQSFNGGLTVNGGTFTGAGGAVSTSNVTLSSGTLTAPSSAGTFNVSGNWSRTGGTLATNGGTVNFTAASGTQTLNSGGASFNNVSHTGAGTLQLVTNSLTAGGTLTNSAGILDIAALNANVGQLSLQGGAITGTTGVLTSTSVIDARNGSVSAKLAGSNGLTKTTSGTVTLSGANTYNGPTAVDAGKLLITGSIASSPTTVNNTGTLGGTGTTGGVTVTSGGKLSPGVSPGILTTGALTLASGATYDVEVGGNTAGSGSGYYDQDIVSGDVTLGGATLNLSSFGGYVPQPGDVYTIIKNNGGNAVSGIFNGLPEKATIVLAGVTLNISYVGGAGRDVVLVANQSPTVAANSPSVTAAEGSPATNAGTFGDPQGNSTVTLTASLGTITQNSSAGTWSWSIPTTDGPAGPTTVAITATDYFGAVATTTFTYSVNNVMPVVTAPANQSSNEAAATSFALGSFTDPGDDTPWEVTVNWGDGSSNSVFTTASTGTIPAQTHTYADNGNYTATVTVREETGTGSSGSASFAVSVNNVAPSLTISGAGSVNEGVLYTLNLASSDPGADTIQSWSINWGDGNIQSVSGNPSSATHIYADGPSSYTISATATDEDGSYSANTVGVSVNNVSPTLTISGPGSVDEGALYSLNLASSDPGADTIQSWSINWGDGNTETVSGNPASVTHTYADGPASYT